MPYSIHEKWVDPSVAYLFNRTLHEVTQLKRELGVYKKLMRETLSVMLTKNGESIDDAKNYTIRNHAITEVMTRIRSVCYENQILGKQLNDINYRKVKLEVKLKQNEEHSRFLDDEAKQRDSSRKSNTCELYTQLIGTNDVVTGMGTKVRESCQTITLIGAQFIIIIQIFPTIFCNIKGLKTLTTLTTSLLVLL